MKEAIMNNMSNPGKLERLYRDNKANFKREFNLIYPDIKENPMARTWNERLNYEKEEIEWGSSLELIFVVVASCIAGFIAKIPAFTGIDPDYFYLRNIAFIFFPMLMAYFSWKHKVPLWKIIIVSLILLVSVIYMNTIPGSEKSDTLILACIHLPLLLWAVTGFVFTGVQFKDYQKRLDFLRYNADLVVLTAVILISGGILAGTTLQLFRLIDLDIKKFYAEYIIVWGLSASPIVGTYLVRTNPHLVNKVSPVIAMVFTPLVLITLVVYLAAVIFTGKDPYNDREFLFIFNLLLIGVMGLIFFSIAETSKNFESKTRILLLIGLSVVTIIINGIALSAILYRISEWGITPNRLAVLGGNTLIMVNLLLVTYHLFKIVKNGNSIEKVENSIASYLPVYVLWTIVVTFIFPLVFGFN